MPQSTKRGRNGSVAFLLAAIVFSSIALAYAAVPLYALFCQVTGFGGTTQRSATLPDALVDRVMFIRFNADVDPGLPWSFEPVQREVKLRVGEQGLAFYRATNNSSEPVDATAVFNVTPHKAGGYFDKIECFCFSQQHLKPGESAELPVTFFIDPEIMNDRKLDDVSTITLSYTFFRTQQQSKQTGPERETNG